MQISRASSKAAQEHTSRTSPGAGAVATPSDQAVFANTSTDGGDPLQWGWRSPNSPSRTAVEAPAGSYPLPRLLEDLEPRDQVPDTIERLLQSHRTAAKAAVAEI